jgi:hypothetical protein
MQKHKTILDFNRENEYGVHNNKQSEPDRYSYFK